MEITDVLRFTNREDFRQWLSEHAEYKSFCWVILSRKQAADGLLYLDAVEEALCFGWIDGIAKKTEEGELAQRFTPRRPNSNWTELNKERVRRLERLGLMQPSGRQVLPDMSPDAFVIDEVIQARLQEDPIVDENFNNFPELYRRIRIDTIQSVRKNPVLYEKRLQTLIEKTKQSQMYGQWNDGGRLFVENQSTTEGSLFPSDG
ncbi:YdeI/OmpD-associated family protein [Exiguobacterium acetylicum]|uniref:YdeI/OmpD-associated family protein n=1 Tax=Exiguobacterium acetylicum TaxID=41170 RepID=UPI001EE1A987|nr:YdeI/OmpD-associated family protein [Exiguobacterium acetylicum]UKS57448.1 YdeI/OmpD-associated family protein [Exiguobacterium acetylicum]